MKTPRKHQKEAIEAINSANEGIIQLPTGTGKTFIEALAIQDNITKGIKWAGEGKVPVFVILGPRIILCNQLYLEVKEILLQQNQDCQYLIVHSGRTEDKKDWKNSENLPYRNLKSTTRISEIKEQYEKAVSENIPLVIFGTYDSSERIVQSGIPVYMLLCDEAHYLVSNEFGWIPLENESSEIKQFEAHRKYYFTATLKETASDRGLGMNNSDLFGPILYSKTPQDMVIAGEIVRPRMHLVDVSNPPAESSEDDIDVNAIIESFQEHRAQIKFGAKILVVTKGSKHLNNMVTHPRMQEFLETRPNLKIFDISSQFQPRINGEIVKREKFLSSLQSLTDADEAIIFHINILTEGIDVPGISGVMVMNNLSLSKFLQTLGRSTRLHSLDRPKLYEGKITYNELQKFVKDYAWIIVPVYDTTGNDLKVEISEIIYALRGFGFEAAEEVVIRKSKGSIQLDSLENLNKKDEKVARFHNIFMEITHQIEEKEEADRLTLEEFKMLESIKNKSDEELINFFKN